VSWTLEVGDSSGSRNWGVESEVEALASVVCESRRDVGLKHEMINPGLSMGVLRLL